MSPQAQPYKPQSAEEAAFLREYQERVDEYPRVGVTVDLALLTIRDGQLQALMVRRRDHPYRGMLAMPGGFVQPDETADQAVAREIREETGLDIGGWHVEQLRTYSDPDRDPRMRIISIAYLCFVPVDQQIQAGDDADSAGFVPIDLLLGDGPVAQTVAFDHRQILADAVDRCRSKLEYTTLAVSFLPKKFSMGELRRVYQAVWGVQLRMPNFRRKVLSSPGFVVPVPPADQSKGASKVPETQYFMAGDAQYVVPPMVRPGPKA